MSLLPTSGQTIGPFFGYSLPYDGGENLVPAHYPNAVRLTGTVYDGAGAPVPDALVEIWQPDQAGAISRLRGSLNRDGHTFTGFGRSATTRDGVYSFTTVEPGTLADSESAPFFACIVFARGLTDKLHTRIYLPDADDAFLASLPADRRTTLIARRESDGSLHHDIHLQGETETVFLDLG
ncbi:MAG: protocatechuate 3,4-dioxygenase subunit alpha [Lacisediminihabitans sp.]